MKTKEGLKQARHERKPSFKVKQEITKNPILGMVTEPGKRATNRQRRQWEPPNLPLIKIKTRTKT